MSSFRSSTNFAPPPFDTSLISIVFKNMADSAEIRNAILDEIVEIGERFPELERHLVKVSLSREGASDVDVKEYYSVRISVRGPSYPAFMIEISGNGIGRALSDILEHFNERLTILNSHLNEETAKPTSRR